MAMQCPVGAEQIPFEAEARVHLEIVEATARQGFNDAFLHVAAAAEQGNAVDEQAHRC